MRKLSRLAFLLIAVSWLSLEPARASFHEVLVKEVFPGFASDPTAQFVELQAYASGQNQVMGQSIEVFNATGGFLRQFAFSSNVNKDADQVTFLFATARAQTLFGVVPDVAMDDAVIDPAGGMVCYTGSEDCVSWGSFSSVDPRPGNPYSPAGLPLGLSAQRNLGANGILDPSDDTNDSAADFGPASPTPQNNAGATRTTPGYGSTPAPSSTIAFGSIVVGSTLPANLIVQETGGGTLTVSSRSLTGTNKADFSVTTAIPFSIVNGGPAKTVQLTCKPAAVGLRTATLTLTTNDALQPSVAYSLTCTGQAVPPSLDFFTVPPCRVIDTRDTGNPVVAGVEKTIAITRLCAVPTTAKAVSLNVTVTEESKDGNVRLYPADTTAPLVSTLNYVAGQTRANNAVVGLDSSGRLKVLLAPSGFTHLILDVNGYFQ
jgi:hypothetical protein